MNSGNQHQPSSIIIIIFINNNWSITKAYVSLRCSDEDPYIPCRYYLQQLTPPLPPTNTHTRTQYRFLTQGWLRKLNLLKVIPFNCITHPFCASFLAWLARARARAPSELYKFSMKAELFREINGLFLLNELGYAHFLPHKFNWHTV